MAATELSAEAFRKVTSPAALRLTVAEVEAAMSATSGSRMRVYALAGESIVKVSSQYYLDKYRDTVSAYWTTTTILSDIIRKA